MTRLLNEMLDRLHGALEANRRFAADASHELRGPLTALLGEIDVTLKRDREPEEYREVLGLLRRTGGAGLGLAISREVVQLFKGSLRVGDSSGSGTTIEVALPGGLATS